MKYISQHLVALWSGVLGWRYGLGRFGCISFLFGWGPFGVTNIITPSDPTRKTGHLQVIEVTVIVLQMNSPNRTFV